MWYVCACYNMSYILSQKVCYIYFLFRIDSSTKLYLSLYWSVCESYNGVWIDMFVYFILYSCCLYFILVILSYISPMYGLLFHCIVVTPTILLIYWWMLYLCLIRYVHVLSTICSLVVIHSGNNVMYIYWFIMPMLPYLLNCIYNSGLRPPCFNLLLICHMHQNTNINSYFLNISYIYFHLKVFCCLLFLGDIFTFNIEHSKKRNQHHMYNIFDKVPSF